MVISVARPGHPGEERHLSDTEFVDALTDMFGLQFTAVDAIRLTAITRDRDRPNRTIATADS
jgi:hypothetical protein